MFRTAGLVSAWIAAVLASEPASAQDVSTRFKAPIAQRLKSSEGASLDDGIRVPRSDSVREMDAAEVQQKAIDRVRELSRTRTKAARRSSVEQLAQLGARAPFAYSAGGTHLVAAMRDGKSLAIWDAAQREQVRTLENSDRWYSQVAITDEARWIAGVRQDDGEIVDLWRADSGQYLRAIRVAGGCKKLDFKGDDELHALNARGERLAFSVPSGIAVGGGGSGQGGTGAVRPNVRVESADRAPPAAPSTTRGAQRSPPRMALDREPEGQRRSVPRGAPRPSMAAPQDTSSEPREEAAFAPAAAAPDEAGSELPVEPATPIAPTAAAPDEPSSRAAAAPAAADDEPSTPTLETAEAGQTEGAPLADSEPTPGHGDIGSESPPETTPRATDRPTVEPGPPSSVVIHFATNRNRLAPKDREWLTYFLGFFTSTPAVIVYVLLVLALLIFPWFGKRSWAARALLAGAVGLCAMACLEAYVRSQLRGEMTGELYGCRPTEVSYGTCEISVPPAEHRRPGELSRPVSVWIFEAPENPDEHFMLRHVTEHKDQSAFYASLSAQLKQSDVSDALLFIHGYNVSFEDAIFRTAQLTVDLEFRGAPIAFCWPSYADPVKYTFDEQQAEVSIPALRELLDGLATQSGAKRIHVIAHSMGNRVLAGALRSMDPAANARNKEVLRELVLAAPDIDSRVFQSQLLPHIIRNARHCTLYASSHDRALLMSRYFHNYQRLGETQPDLLVTNELDTIDASLVDTSLMGHSYIANAQSIVADLHDLLVGGKRPAERFGLEALRRNAATYWLIKPEPQTASDPLLRR